MTALSTPTFAHIDALITFGTGVLLPSGDVYSDIALSMNLLNKSCADYDNQEKNCNTSPVPKGNIEFQHRIGWMIWIPIVINLLFTIPHFLRVEKTAKQRFLTLPFLICQRWPQYRSLRVLWFAYVPHNIAKCLTEKAELEQNVCNLGKKLTNK